MLLGDLSDEPPAEEEGITEPIPSAVDWRQNGKVTPVKDQGQCASGWAFSTTGSMECDYAIKNGDLNSLSEQQIVDCSYDNYGCNGGWYEKAWEYSKNT